MKENEAHEKILTIDFAIILCAKLFLKTLHFTPDFMLRVFHIKCINLI